MPLGTAYAMFHADFLVPADLSVSSLAALGLGQRCMLRAGLAVLLSQITPVRVRDRAATQLAKCKSVNKKVLRVWLSHRGWCWQDASLSKDRKMQLRVVLLAEPTSAGAQTNKVFRRQNRLPGTCHVNYMQIYYFVPGSDVRVMHYPLFCPVGLFLGYVQTQVLCMQPAVYCACIIMLRVRSMITKMV